VAPFFFSDLCLHTGAMRLAAHRIMRSACACLWLATLMAPLAAACDRAASPAVPSTAAPSAAAAPVPPTAGSASLVIESFKVEPWPSGPTSDGWYFYLPTVVLREVGGKSAARLSALEFGLPNGDKNLISAAGCLLTNESRVVQAGQSWNSSQVYLYCLDLDSKTSLAGKSVTLTIRFKDENSVDGAVQGRTTVEN
jgi:hypothetical protein